MTALSGVVSIDFGAASAATLLLLALGTALVGFSEELLTRGLMIVGFRGTLSEGWVWFLSSLLLRPAARDQRVLRAVRRRHRSARWCSPSLLGTAFYVTRRLTGLLVVTMVIHAIWDFGVLGTEHSGAEALAVGGLLVWPTAIVAFVVLAKILRSPAGTPRGVPHNEPDTVRRSPSASLSVEEVPGPGEVHRHAGRLGRGDDLVVTHRATGLDDRTDAGVDQHLQSVREREEGVGRGN